jgi:hypothetical protein
MTLNMVVELREKRKFNALEDESVGSIPQKRRKEGSSLETSSIPFHFLPSLPLSLPPPSPQSTESIQDIPLLDINLNEDPSSPPLTIQQHNQQPTASLIQNSINQNSGQKVDNNNNINENTTQNQKRTRRARRKRYGATQSIQIQITRKCKFNFLFRLH